MEHLNLYLLVSSNKLSWNVIHNPVDNKPATVRVTVVKYCLPNYLLFRREIGTKYSYLHIYSYTIFSLWNFYTRPIFSIIRSLSHKTLAPIVKLSNHILEIIMSHRIEAKTLSMYSYSLWSTWVRSAEIYPTITVLWWEKMRELFFSSHIRQ